MSKRSRDTSPEPPDSLSSTSKMIPSSPSRHKYPHMEHSPEQSNTLMHCSLPPHKGDLTFPTYEAYESHYLQTHVNRCSECTKNFPSDLLLTRHIEENHDPVMEERKERGEKTVLPPPCYAIVCLKMNGMSWRCIVWLFCRGVWEEMFDASEAEEAFDW